MAEVHIALELWQLVLGVIVYTTSVIGALMWLNNKLNSLLPAARYELLHRSLTARVRAIELWAARKNSPPFAGAPQEAEDD